MNIKTMLAALQGVTTYKDILALPVMDCALRLVSRTVHGDGLGGLEAYTDLFYRLRVEGHPGLGSWLGEALRWSEGPYPLLVERDQRDPALEQAARLDISAFELLASVDCDKWLSHLARLLGSDYQGVLTSLPRWQRGGALLLRRPHRGLSPGGRGEIRPLPGLCVGQRVAYPRGPSGLPALRRAAGL